MHRWVAQASQGSVLSKGFRTQALGLRKSAVGRLRVSAKSPLLLSSFVRVFSTTPSVVASAVPASPVPASAEVSKDAVPTTWVDRMPTSVQPYLELMRLEKPIGTWLLLWPCFWSTALQPLHTLPDFKLMALFGVGAVVMRGAGCTINDLWDRDFDGKVYRTKNRPIVSGRVTVPKAVAFLGAQLGVGLGVLLQLPTYCWGVAMASMPLVIGYPLAKRAFPFPQLVLGMTFNWGAFVGYAAVHQSLHWSAILPMYAAGVAWTLVYDTIYAHQDKDDDSKLGLQSTALTFGQYNYPIMASLSAITVGGLALCGYNAGLGAPYYLVSVAGAATHLAWQLGTVDLNNRASCMAKFVSNKWLGFLVFLGLVLDNIYRRQKQDESAEQTPEQQLLQKPEKA